MAGWWWEAPSSHKLWAHSSICGKCHYVVFYFSFPQSPTSVISIPKAIDSSGQSRSKSCTILQESQPATRSNHFWINWSTPSAAGGTHSDDTIFLLWILLNAITPSLLMLYPPDQAPNSNLLVSITQFLLPIPTMPRDSTGDSVPLSIDEEPPDPPPPPPFVPSDPPGSANLISTPATTQRTTSLTVSTRPGQQFSIAQVGSLICTPTSWQPPCKCTGSVDASVELSRIGWIPEQLHYATCQAAQVHKTVGLLYLWN
jgi:hypothetical protein